MEHRRLLNHNQHGGQGKLAALLSDVESQTVKLHAAVESATSSPSAQVIEQHIASIQTTADALSASVASITVTLQSIDPAADVTSQIAALREVEDVLTGAAASIGVDVDAIEAATATVPVSQPEHKPHPHPGPKSNIQWPSFHGSDRLIGTVPSGLVSVYIDASLGIEAEKNATDLLNDADRIVLLNNSIFGTTQATHVNVILFALSGMTDGTGGADHMGCDWKTGSDIEVCVSYGDSARCSGLFMAELCECAMNNQLCGLSTGEALSRWCAGVASSNALSDFATAPTWQQDGSPNFVDKIDSTDQNPDSIGCGMAFISYLMHHGASLKQIARTMVTLGDSGSLADLYATLKMGDKAAAWPSFSTALAGLSPLTSDDPFAQAALSKPSSA
jgi:hypothetical protein